MNLPRHRIETNVLPVSTTPSSDESKDKPKSQPLQSVTYAFMIFLAIATKTWQPMAIKSSQQPDGTYAYNKTAMVLVVEVIKLVFCSGVFAVVWFSTPPPKRAALVNLPFRQSLHFLVPSMLYGASNTLVYYGMRFINPALFHVFGNIRIIIAGVMYRVIMGRKNTDIQWVSLLLLTVGAMMASPEINNPDLLGSSDTFFGMMILTLMCVFSTCSSIYTELNYKKTEELSIFYQNMVLYMYGVAVNTVYLILSDDGTIRINGILYGFDSSSVQTLVAQSLMGITLSFLFKFLDNIVYVISLTVSMLLTALFSILFYDFECSVSFVCAMVIINSAIYLFYRAKIIDRFKWEERQLSF